MSTENTDLFGAAAKPVAGHRMSTRASKAAHAYRNISEVAEELSLAPHVLRFWETKFKELSPMKQQGGRRFYRPEDIALLRRIKTMLHDEGYTIKGVQGVLKKQRSLGNKPDAHPVIAGRNLMVELKRIRALLGE